MKKTRFLFCLLSVLIAACLSAEEYTLESRLYVTITEMEAEGYTLSIKEAGAFDMEEAVAEGYVLDRDPYFYRDPVPPGSPPGLRGAALNSTTVALTFFAATDNTRVIGYNVFRDGQHIGYSTEESYLDEELMPSMLYRYNVQAVDKRLNLSEISESVFVTTLDTVAQVSPPRFVISPSVSYVTNEMAIISFIADKATKAVVEYGADTNYGGSVTVSDYLTEHSVVVTNLDSESQYHYRVTITDYDNNDPAVSSDDTFWTLFAPDLKPPEFIASPQAAYVSDTRAVITFQTDEDTLSYVLYGQSHAGENRVDEAYYTNDHSIILYGLYPMTNYTAVVSIEDRTGNGPVESQEISFGTEADPDTTPPLILGKPIVIYLSDTLAAINWKTDELSNSVVDFGTTFGNYDRRATSQVMTRDHLVLLPNLEERTRYYFAVSSADAADTYPPGGNVGTEIRYGHDNDSHDNDSHDNDSHDNDSHDNDSHDDDSHDDDKRGNDGKHHGIFKFDTKRKDDVKPPKIDRIEAITTLESATISWRTKEIAEGKILYWTDTGFPVYQKSNWRLEKNHELILTGLEPEASYYFQIVCKDPGSNEATTRVYSFDTVENVRHRKPQRR